MSPILVHIMPLVGGAANKFGNRYEGRWTVLCLTEILDERADSIRLEPPGPEGQGIEFWLRKGAVTEYHQVKRQHGQRHYWSISELAKSGVLHNFLAKLDNENSRCVFVSTNPTEFEELCQRSRDAVSFEEFKREFVQAKQLLEQLGQLRQTLGLQSDEGVHRYLKGVYNETISESTLKTFVESRLATLVDGDPANVLDTLAQFALDNVHKELIASDLWNHLESRGHRRRAWGKDDHVLAAVEAANTRYFTGIMNEAVGGKMIPREEASRALQILTSPDTKSSVLFVGEAGVGKSSVIYQTVEGLHDRGWPILALRVDRLDATQLPDNVGEQLGLPGSPANVLAAIAQGRDCALVVDQLDAVSLASGRHTQFFDCIDEIINQSRAHPNMRLILASRKFDVDNDHRLQRLKGDVASAVTIGRLSQAIVKEVVAEMGLAADRLGAKQLDLLSVPLHLKLLAETAQDANSEAFDFQTVNDLYGKFCMRKQVLIRAAIGRPVGWNAVIGAMSDHMSRHQVLSVPKLIIEEQCNAEDAWALASWHVLIDDGSQYAFFHESFFDYAFARRLVSLNQRLIDLLKSGEQHLFRRAQTRQILIHQREAARASYLDDLTAILNDPEIRFHLKDAAVALMSAIPDPTEEEWRAIAPILDDPSNPLALKLWRILTNSPAWIRLIDSLGVVEAWLANTNDNLVDQAVALLAEAQQYIPDRVVELTEPYIRAGGLWNRRLLYVMERSRLSRGALHESRRFFEFFLTLIDEGVLDDVGSAGMAHDFWSLLYSLCKPRPEWCCEAIGRYLNRRLEMSLSNGQPNPFDQQTGTIPETHLDKQILVDCARAAPKEFVEAVLPFMLSVIEHNIRGDSPPPWEDSIWWMRVEDQSYRTEESLLVAMKNAMCKMAQDDPEGFALTAAEISELGFETIQYLLIVGYSANGARFANDAADYILELPARLRTGDSSDSYSATRNLLRAITPFCSNERLERIEETLLSYYSQWEKTAGGRRARGYRQFMLLDSVDPTRLSYEGVKRLREWQRKFNRTSPGTPTAQTGFDTVPSPIPEKATERMMDEHWLKAIERYDYDWNDARPERQFTGGAVELSRLMELEVKKAPARFAALCLRIPDTANPTYFNHILTGISGSELNSATVIEVCERCHRLPNKPCGREICSVLSKLPDTPLPNEAVEMLAWYGVQDSDPARELWRRNGGDDTIYYGGDPANAGLNSVRGGAAFAIGKLIFDGVDRAKQLLPVVEAMVSDPSIAVRSWVVNALIALLNYNRDKAIDLFTRACDTEDELLQTKQVEFFLSYAIHTHFKELRPILERMLTSSLPGVVTIGARRVCLAGLLHADALALALSCISGTDAHRMGAAHILAGNIGVERARSFCSDALIRFFNDPNEEVRKWAASCFHHLEGDQLLEHVDLVEAFVESEAFASQHSALVEALGKVVAKLPDITIAVCGRVIEIAGSDTADFRTRGPLASEEVSKLLIRLYSQNANPALQSQCLDLIDRMIQIGSYGLQEAIAVFER